MIVKINKINCKSSNNTVKSLNSFTQLGFYLAVLIEGDGNNWTAKPTKSAKGHINNPQRTFTFYANLF